MYKWRLVEKRQGATSVSHKFDSDEELISKYRDLHARGLQGNVFDAKDHEHWVTNDGQIKPIS